MTSRIANGDARGAYAQGAQNVVGKLKDALTPGD